MLNFTCAFNKDFKNIAKKILEILRSYISEKFQ